MSLNKNAVRIIVEIEFKKILRKERNMSEEELEAYQKTDYYKESVEKLTNKFTDDDWDFELPY